jgi:hypothetical protein
MPGGKTTNRYRWTPCRPGQISIEPQRYSPSIIRDHLRASLLGSRFAGRRLVSNMSFIYRHLPKLASNCCPPNTIYTGSQETFTALHQVFASCVAQPGAAGAIAMQATRSSPCTQEIDGYPAAMSATGGAPRAAPPFAAVISGSREVSLRSTPDRPSARAPCTRLAVIAAACS